MATVRLARKLCSLRRGLWSQASLQRCDRGSRATVRLDRRLLSEWPGSCGSTRLLALVGLGDRGSSSMGTVRCNRWLGLALSMGRSLDGLDERFVAVTSSATVRLDRTLFSEGGALSIVALDRRCCVALLLGARASVWGDKSCGLAGLDERSKLDAGLDNRDLLGRDTCVDAPRSPSTCLDRSGLLGRLLVSLEPRLTDDRLDGDLVA
jgi:hypothetical protein